MKNNKNAFTLIELLVVISIIGLIASIVVVSLGGSRADARDAKRLADLKQIQTGLELFYNKYGLIQLLVLATRLNPIQAGAIVLKAFLEGTG